MDSTLKAYLQSLKDEKKQLQEKLKEASSKMAQLADPVIGAMTKLSLALFDWCLRTHRLLLLNQKPQQLLNVCCPVMYGMT